MKHLFRSSQPGLADYAGLALFVLGYIATLALLAFPEDMLAAFAG